MTEELVSRVAPPTANAGLHTAVFPEMAHRFFGHLSDFSLCSPEASRLLLSVCILKAALEPQQSSWLAPRAASRFHLQRPHDVHAMSTRLQSFSLYLEEKRAASLIGSARAFFAQRFTVPLDCIR